MKQKSDELKINARLDFGIKEIFNSSLFESLFHFYQTGAEVAFHACINITLWHMSHMF